MTASGTPPTGAATSQPQPQPRVFFDPIAIGSKLGLGVAKKLTEVMGAIDRIRKNGENAQFNFRYVKESDVLDAVRSELSSRGVLFTPRFDPEKDVKWSTFSTKAGGPAIKCTLFLRGEFMDSETGEIHEIPMIGEASDTGMCDKSFSKALSGAIKYAMLKQFLIATGNDDPETVSGERAEGKGKQAAPPTPWEEMVAFAKSMGLDDKAITKVAQARMKATKKKKVDADDVTPVRLETVRQAFLAAPDKAALRKIGETVQKFVGGFNEDERARLAEFYKGREADFVPKDSNEGEPGADG